MKKITLLLVAIAMVAAQPAMAQKKSRKSKQPEAVANASDTNRAWRNLNETFGLINRFYVENPNFGKLSETGIHAMLRELDPHSIFIPERDVEKANESLNGNFEGVGISFQIVKDTIQVADVIVGGPSEKVGLMIGDKIVRIDGNPAVGDSVNNSFVTKHLRGKKGTTVVLDVLRANQVISFSIVRDKVPIYSVDSHFMIDSTTGYIRLTRFARTSASEMYQAINDLNKQGMKKLVFDLRGNGGGFLDIAFNIADMFLPAGKLIVYQEGRMQPRQNFMSTRRGAFQQGELVVLIDESSASASEIVSGCLQDWDRATIVGRRSFGKGLVQRMYPLSDGSQVRLTTARYYTPSGRCIQKPYDKGVDVYFHDLERRYNNGEMVHPDSVRMPDSLKFQTASGRTVYGGGGITPDVFVPLDTTRLSDYYLNLRSKGLINDFCNDFANQHRGQENLADFNSFMAHYDEMKVDDLFAAYAESKNVSKVEVKGEWVAAWVADQFKKQLKDSTNAIHAEDYASYVAQWQQDKEFMESIAEKARKEDKRRLEINRRSEEYLHYMLKSLIAKNLYGIEYYYKVMKDQDEGLKASLKVLNH
ncbi:MAG: S41 family peptidase [Bacteroidales bacterium]|nr:S41 family peptidase [Bacteroidales bacterium]